jgi:hypothetical protein
MYDWYSNCQVISYHNPTNTRLTYDTLPESVIGMEWILLIQKVLLIIINNKREPNYHSSYTNLTSHHITIVGYYRRYTVIVN